MRTSTAIDANFPFVRKWALGGQKLMTDSTVFGALKTALRERGWSIPYFARTCGVSTQLAYKWLAEDEATRITPSPASCEKIAAALGFDADYVLELAGHRKAQSERTPLHPDVVAISGVWSSLDEGIQRAVRILVGIGPVSAPGTHGFSARGRNLKRGKHGQDGNLTELLPAAAFALFAPY